MDLDELVNYPGLGSVIPESSGFIPDLQFNYPCSFRQSRFGHPWFGSGKSLPDPNIPRLNCIASTRLPRDTLLSKERPVNVHSLPFASASMSIDH